eukprot:756872-Hanusia_phi.AAC.2
MADPYLPPSDCTVRVRSASVGPVRQSVKRNTVTYIPPLASSLRRVTVAAGTASRDPDCDK